MTERLSDKYPCDNCNSTGFCGTCEKIMLWTGKALNKIKEYETAEKEGRLVVLPVGVGDEVYIIEKCLNILERLDGTLYDSDGSLGTATGYYCPYEINCPFGDDDFTLCDDYKEKLAVFKDCVDGIYIRENEVSIFTENTFQYYSFEKTVFLTRGGAEKALKEMEGNHE